jgi:fucose permease
VILYLVGAYCPWRAVALAACMAMGLAVSGLWPTTLGVTADRFPHGGATMFALLAALGNLGGTVTMPIGAIAERAGLHAAIASVAICPAILLGILLWLRGAAHKAAA